MLIKPLSVAALVAVFTLSVSGCDNDSADDQEAVNTLAYPQTLRVDQVDDYHGNRIADPYRWLEATDSAGTLAWIRAQNELTERYLERLPGRDGFSERMRDLINYERFGIPAAGGGRFVYFYNPGDLDQDQLWLTDNLAQRGRVLVDPNKLSADGSVSIGDFALSPDGKWLAYSVSDGGSDWRIWRVMNLDSRNNVDEELAGIKFSSIAWTADSRSFYYSRYPPSGDDPADGFDDQRQVSIWRHRINTPQADDQFVYAVTDHPTRNPYARTTDDGRFLVIELADGFETSGLYVQKLDDGKPTGEVIRLLNNWDAIYEYVANIDNRFLIRTSKDAPLGKIIAVNVDAPTDSPGLDIVPESEFAIQSAAYVGGRLIISDLVDARSRVRLFSAAGEAEGELALPGQGSVSGFRDASNASETFFSYTDFTTPLSIYRFRPTSGDVELVHAPKLMFDPQDFQSRQIYYASKDGTRIPMTIVAARSAEVTDPRPTVLYGYGGFNVSLLPRYSSARMAWLQAGGVYAEANLRGGGEYGEAWHQAGTRLQKQNVFDDFIAAAEWLIESKITTSDQLAMWGGSNGGLLVGAVLNQRPDLFAAAVPSVGVMDMLRYHTASANARQWSSDYGLSEDPAEFSALSAYSPYHNVAFGVCHPATMIMADTNDDRVSPWHSYKYAAALQYMQACEKPALIRIETRTGHGAGASTSKLIAEYADQWAFVAHHVGLTGEILN